MNRFLLHGLDLVGIGFHLLQVRRPFDLDRCCRRIAGARSRSGLRGNRLPRMKFPHRFPFVRDRRRGRLIHRRADVLHGLSHFRCGGMMRALRLG